MKINGHHHHWIEPGFRQWMNDDKTAAVPSKNAYLNVCSRMRESETQSEPRRREMREYLDVISNGMPNKVFHHFKNDQMWKNGKFLWWQHSRWISFMCNIWTHFISPGCTAMPRKNELYFLIPISTVVISIWWSFILVVLHSVFGSFRFQIECSSFISFSATFIRNSIQSVSIAF